MRRAFVVAFVLLLPRLGHAMLGLETMENQLAASRSVEIVRVEHGAGVVVESHRGRPKGAVATPDATATRDGEYLVICGEPYWPDHECSWFPDLGGFFLPRAHGRKGPVILCPGIVDRTAVAPLAARRPAPPLRIAAPIELLDEPRAVPAESIWSAADGRGTLTVGSGGTPYPASLQAGELSGEPSAYLSIIVDRADGGPQLVLRGDGPVRREAGRFEVARLIPVSAQVRTLSGLERGVRGKLPVEVPLARGFLDLDGGAGLKKGRHPITLTLDLYGAGSVVCDLLGAGWQLDLRGAAVRMVFARAGTPAGEIILEGPADRGRTAELERLPPSQGAARALRDTKRWTVLARPSAAAATTVGGTATLEYLPEKRAARP